MLDYKKKILIFFPVLKERSGGPATYLYNLKQFIVENNLSNQVFFLSDFLIESKEFSGFKWGKYLKSIIKNVFSLFLPIKILMNNFLIRKYVDELKNGEISYQIKEHFSLNDYDYIHFHSVFHLYGYRNYLTSYNGKIILTSHSPQAPHLEYIESFYGMSLNNIWKKNLIELEIMERISFVELSDYLFFPCKEALEPYYNTYPPFKEIIELNKVKYIPTGIGKIKPVISRDEIKVKYNIEKNNIIISYVGRHNNIKGYDLLLKFGQSILNKYSNITFLIAGIEHPLQGLNHPKWIEVGWTNDPYSIINASDIFILPNKETYFDLILLEAMSLKKPVLLSATGGNKYFQRYATLGLMYFKNNDLEDMVTVFENSLEDHKKWSNYGNINHDIINNFLSINNFGNNYIDTINRLDL